MAELASMPKYESYRDLGIDWLGKLPSGWEAIRMKFLFKDTSIKNRAKETLLSVTQNQGVIPRDWVENRMVMPSGNLESFKFIEKGDFAISLRSFEGGLEYCHHDGIISPAYTVLKAKRKSLIEGYYKYLFKSQAFISELQTSIVGIREGKNISYEELQYSLLPIPAENEQTAIANFLDKKTAQIDKAIAIKEKQIELLKERKQILIQQAVTQGLNPDVPMKDSGVDWIGKTPEHWDVKKIKYLTKIFRGKFTHRPRNDPALYDGQYPFFQTGDVARANKFLYEYKQTLNEKGLRVSTLIPKGTVVITIAANIGDVAILALDACFPDSVVGFSPYKETNRDFLYYALGNMKQQFMDSSIKNTQMNLNVDRIGSNSLCQPPIEEQVKIVELIESESKTIDDAVELQKQQIEKLKEYKTTLINSVVTGKIKVPGVIEG